MVMTGSAIRKTGKYMGEETSKFKGQNKKKYILVIIN